MKPGKAGQPYSAAINHVIVGQVLHSPALNEGHVLVNPPYLELLTAHCAQAFAVCLVRRSYRGQPSGPLGPHSPPLCRPKESHKQAPRASARIRLQSKPEIEPRQKLGQHRDI